MNKKHCNTCAQDKPVAEFSKASKSHDGLASKCKPCCSAYHKARHHLVADKNKARAVAWAQENRERRAATNKEWRDRSKDHCKATSAAWYQLNKEAKNAKRRAYYIANKKRETENANKYRLANLDRYKETGAAYYLVNKDHMAAIAAEWYINNREIASQNGKEWRAANPHKVAAKQARRRATLLQATPAWADNLKIDGIYAASAQSEIECHVDHIVPLNSKFVCGLHCEANLQILPALENIKKSNRHWPDMP
jgi:hypothetical protein